MKFFGLIELTKRLFGAKQQTQGEEMSKEQIIADAKAALLAGQDQVLSQVLGDVADKAYAEQKEADGTVTTPADQSVIDGLNAQVADLQGKLDAAIAQDAADVKAGQDAAAALQVQIDSLSKELETVKAEKSAEDEVVAGLQGQVQSIRDLADKLAAIVVPQPAPVPVPQPEPAPDAGA